MHCDGGGSRQGNDTSKKTEKHQKRHFFCVSRGEKVPREKRGEGNAKTVHFSLLCAL